MAKDKFQSDGATITVSVPIAIRKRGGRKIVLAPDGTPQNPQALRCQQVDNAMVKALARAFRWREMLESGEYATITEIADAEQIDHGYVGRILRLTLLAPDIVDRVLSGKHSHAFTVAALRHAFPLDWVGQKRLWEMS
jgi:hypothetical protein